MIAGLPMYDRPALRGAHDRLWQAFRARYAQAPARLEQEGDVWALWQSPDLLLAQTCGLPFRARLQGQVTLVGSPDHWLKDCPPGYYRSHLIRRAGDSRDLTGLARGVLAVNDGLSQSGWAAPSAHLAEQGLHCARAVHSGAHAASVAMVAQGAADWAAIDAVTWAMLARDTPDLTARVVVFDSTMPTPALPYITAPGRDGPALRAAFAGAIAALDAADRDALCLHGLVDLGAQAYTELPLPEAPPFV